MQLWTFYLDWFRRLGLTMDLKPVHLLEGAVV